jgi:hypothetical protein
MTKPALIKFEHVPSIKTVSIKKMKLTRDDFIKQNSVTLNFISLLVLLGICYFFYNVYKERNQVV